VERASPLLEDGRGEALPTFWFDPSVGTTSGLNFKIDAEGSDNLSKAYAKGLATEKAMQDRFADYQTRYQLRYP
jgi:hypothetical protein